jgi:hypothetical protein
MHPQLDNKIITSFLLYIDNRIQQVGEAYYNTNGLFYPTISNVNGLYAYTCPYKQLCNDLSVSNATVMSGVYLNNTYVSVGQSGLVAINHYDGAVYFNSGLPKNTIVSGNFGIKEFSVYLSDQPDYKLLFETKYYPNPRYGNIPKSGLALDTKTAPAVYLTIKSQENKPLAFAGLDDNSIQLRAVIVAENVYQKIAVCNILKNLYMRPFKLIESTPIDYLGNMTGINYNYAELPASTFYKPLVLKSKVSEINLDGEFLDMKKQFAFVDFDISTWNGNV